MYWRTLQLTLAVPVLLLLMVLSLNPASADPEAYASAVPVVEPDQNNLPQIFQAANAPEIDLVLGDADGDAVDSSGLAGSAVTMEEGVVGSGYADDVVATEPDTTHLPLPEPTTLLLVGTGLLGLAAYAKLRARS